MTTFFYYALDCGVITYCGYTADLATRIAQHYYGIGARVTKIYRPRAVVATAQRELRDRLAAEAIEASFARFISDVFNCYTSIGWCEFPPGYSKHQQRFKLSYPRLEDFISVGTLPANTKSLLSA